MFIDTPFIIHEPRRPAVPERDVERMWIARAQPDVEFESRCGRRVRVIDAGSRNRHDGPDFLGAAVTVDGALRRGDIELHTFPEDWRRHGHGGDPRYARVVLHVCLYDGAFPPDIPGIVLATQLGRPFRAAWADARGGRHGLPCLRDTIGRPAAIGGFTRVGSERIEAMAALLAAQRFSRKCRRMELRHDLLRRSIGDAEAFRQMVYEAVARAAGYGGNEQLFETMSRSVPLCDVAATPAAERRVRLTAAVPGSGNSAGVMPHNRLARRLSWFSSWVARIDEREWWRALIATLCAGAVAATDYIALFRVDGERDNPGPGRVAEIMINVFAPALHVDARRRGNAELARAASSLYFSMKPAPGNRYTRLFAHAFELQCESGERQQGMIELATAYCQKGRCAQCLHAHG